MEEGRVLCTVLFMLQESQRQRGDQVDGQIGMGKVDRWWLLVGYYVLQLVQSHGISFLHLRNLQETVSIRQVVRWTGSWCRDSETEMIDQQQRQPVSL